MPQEDSYVVERIRAAGAIIIGKTNVPEFGFGSQTYNEVFGTTRNAFDQRLTSGGSSGGAAVALALDMLPVADGSDMGGSLRNPAAWNNVFGFRTSPGRVAVGPANELFMAQMGVKGPMARNVADLALLLGVQAGYDPRAPLSLDDVSRCLGSSARSATCALPGSAISAAVCRSRRALLDLCTAALEARASGRLPHRAAAAGFRLRSAVAGFRHASPRDRRRGAQAPLRQSRPANPAQTGGDLGNRRIARPDGGADPCGLGGALALVQGRARPVRRFDLLVLPSAQVFAFDAETHWPAEIAGRKMDSYHRWMEVSAFATMAGCPAINVPVGFDKRGRSMGMQLIGRPRGDAEVLTAAAAYELAAVQA